MSSTPQGDEELLLAMRSGDEEAFLELYRRRQGAIHRFVLHMSGSAATAEDITQEVFLALIREECGYDPERGTLAGYLFGIARKLVLRHLERNRGGSEEDLEESRVLGTMPAATADPMADLLRREGLESLRRAVLALPKRYREVVVLCDLEEVDYADAAVLLSCPVGTVRSRLHRARSLLWEKLHQQLAPRSQVDSLKPARSWI